MYHAEIQMRCSIIHLLGLIDALSEWNELVLPLLLLSHDGRGVILDGVHGAFQHFFRLGFVALNPLQQHL